MLPGVLATLIPTTIVATTTATQPTMSNPLSTPTPWPSTFPASVNLFVTRSRPMPPNKEDNPMPVPEEKQKMRGLDLSKFKIPPAREITTSHPAPSVMENSAMASIMAATNTPSPGKRCKRWGPPCPSCVQSPHTPPQWTQTGQKRTGTER